MRDTKRERDRRPLAGARAIGLMMMLALGFALPGCGKSGPVLVPVRGRLLLDGEPLAGKNILLSPAEGTPGSGAGANSRADGSFELLAVLPGATTDRAGVIPGAYKVVVSEPMFPIDFQPEVPQDPNVPQPAISLPAEGTSRSNIPARYRNRDTTPLTIEIQPGGGEITLELQSKS